MNNVSIELYKVAVATEEATQAANEFISAYTALRNRFTWFGWLLFRLGLL
jgi:hypothetical protein